MNSVTAQRGAAFLDERLPGWADMVDVDTLDLASSWNCVVGQIERKLHPRARFPTWQNFGRGLRELGVGETEAQRLGFYGVDDGTVERTWKRLIRERWAVESET